MRGIPPRGTRASEEASPCALGAQVGREPRTFVSTFPIIGKHIPAQLVRRILISTNFLEKQLLAGFSASGTTVYPSRHFLLHAFPIFVLVRVKDTASTSATCVFAACTIPFRIDLTPRDSILSHGPGLEAGRGSCSSQWCPAAAP